MLERPVTIGSAELSRLLERADQAARAADRIDLVDRLAVVQTWMVRRPVRVAVTAGAGAEPLVRVLRAAAPRWLPGASFTGVPGGTRPGSGPVPPGGADVVLFVADAAREYDDAELDVVARLRDQDVPVLGVLTGYDACPDLPAVQQGDRRLLRAAGLDTPPLPLLPVSTAMCDQGWQRGDDPTVVASGIPQLLEFLRDHVDCGVGGRLQDAVLGEVRLVVDHLLPARTDELGRLRAEVLSPRQRQQRAVAELERAQARSAAWQLTLNDGSTEMNAELDFDLRERLREVLSFADDQITNADPFADWAAFDAAIHDRIADAARANHYVLRDRGKGLARAVAAKLGGTDDGAGGVVVVPRVAIDDPGDGLGKLSASEEPQNGGSTLSRVVNSVRGSYGGILMVGVLTSLAGEKLISVYSVGAGVLLGLFTFFEDRKNTRERRRSEGRAAVAKRLDEANFRLGDHQRAQLRTVHRTLRDHFTVVNDDRLRAASDAVRNASEPRDDTEHQERITSVEKQIDELTDLREQSGGGVVPVQRVAAVVR